MTRTRIFTASLIFSILVLSLLGVLFSPLHAATSHSNVEIRVFSNQCLDVPYGNAYDGAEIKTYNCHGGRNQRWDLMANGEIRTRLSTTKCIDVPYSNPDNGRRVTLYTCHGGNNQKWNHQDGGLISSRLAGNKCLDVEGGNTGNGASIVTYSCNGTVNQRFRFSDSGQGRPLSMDSRNWEFCKAEHNWRVIDLWDGYPHPEYGFRDGVEVALVKSVQHALRVYESHTGYLRTTIGEPDGYFGTRTQDAVGELQDIEVSAGGRDGRVGSRGRSFLCNLQRHLGNCRLVDFYNFKSASRKFRMNGCGAIRLSGGLLYRHPDDGSGFCTATISWLSGSGGTKTVNIPNFTQNATLATGVRSGALFNVSTNCAAGGESAILSLQQ